MIKWEFVASRITDSGPVLLK